MIGGVPSRVRALTSDDLAALLDRFPVERMGAKAAADVTEAQLQTLLARIAALTDALRDTQGGDAERLAARILVADLATVVGQFRGRANTLRATLAGADQGLRDALARFKAPDAGTPPRAGHRDKSGHE
jgi:hypothetical protein